MLGKKCHRSLRISCEEAINYVSNMSFICVEKRVRYLGAVWHLAEIDMTSQQHARHIQINQGNGKRVRKVECVSLVRDGRVGSWRADGLLILLTYKLH